LLRVRATDVGLARIRRHWLFFLLKAISFWCRTPTSWDPNTSNLFALGDEAFFRKGIFGGRSAAHHRNHLADCGGCIAHESIRARREICLAYRSVVGLDAGSSVTRTSFRFRPGAIPLLPCTALVSACRSVFRIYRSAPIPMETWCHLTSR
jgi:hypothetical protein